MSNKKIMILKYISLILIIILIGFALGLTYYKFFSNNKIDNNNNSDTNSNEEEIINLGLYDGKKGDIFYLYKYSNNDYINYYKTENKEDNENYMLLGLYSCNYDGCSVLDVVNDKYAIIYDNDYFIYNIKTKTNEKKINIDKIKYSSIEGIYKRDNYIVGIVLGKKETDTLFSYYDIEQERTIIDYGTYKSIKATPALIEKGYLLCSSNSLYDALYSIKENKIKMDKIGYISGNNIIYYYNYNYESSITTLYDENFNIIFKTENNEELIEDYYLTNEDKLIFSSNNVYYIYDSNYKLEYTSKKYNAIYGIYKDYISVNDNDYLKIIDCKEVEQASLCELNKENYVDKYASGWYTENGKNGIYMVVKDDNAKDELTKEQLDKAFAGVGYEYYYIPTTGETGRIAIPLEGGYAKPVLYLYPKEDNTIINITFDKPTLLTTTYPKYINSWQVTANKNGDLIDKNGKYYYGLYWEESGNTQIDFKEGFYVEKDDAIKFLETKLEEIGLNQREANEFIMYWLPILEKNEKSLVYFELTEERQKYNKINIDPLPDSLLRVAIHIKKVDKKQNIKNQEFNKFERIGFTAVEWGGVIHY